MPDYIKKYKIVILIAGIAILLRLIFFGIIISQKNYNLNSAVSGAKFDGYYEIAYNLINHSVFSFDQDNSLILSDTKRTPGYPVILVPFLYFDGAYLVIFLQIILGGVLAALAWLIAWRVTSQAKIANIVGLLMAIDPVGIWLSVKFLTETFFTLFFFLFILSVIKLLKVINHKGETGGSAGNIPILAGLYLGLATLFRPTTLYLPVFLILSWLIFAYWRHKKKQWSTGFIFFISFVIVLSPWFIRNYKVFGVVGYSSIASETLFTYLAPSVISMNSGKGFSESQMIFFTNQGYADYPRVDIANSGEFKNRAIALLKQYPYESILAAGVAATAFFTHDGALSFLQEINLISGALPAKADLIHNFTDFIISPFALIALFRLLWFVIFLTFLWRFLLMWRRKILTSPYVFLLLLIFYFAATTMFNGFGANARFRFPVNSLILIFSVSWGVRKFYEIIDCRSKSRQE
ncbi:MAG: hypothetical protein A3H70_03870 [Candidatus Komeilibacteria bacterium RIFCSPLOWO2_02_FULL_48_11]|uniref:Uncharacterized protein n=1 Tax=Candidatus Komeilibacteria bacterium RIFCSPLOWO2_02_FULL_48_11 TaxID=1798553 RepID=A0A1G2BP01_9BACT|nr:MAG: hypothetical protein A3H70_03870 [Candidatus Komeilibacteria bacterium RIFCSPLOWO2_02_FULL_48_11]